MLKRRFIIEWCVVLVISLFGCLGFINSLIGDKADNLLLDEAISWRQSPPSDAILIVDIDEQSLAEIGRWPWPRAQHAQLVRQLSVARPKAIGYDVLFTEAGPEPGDAALGMAIRQAGNVVLPAYLNTPGANGRAFDVIRPIKPLDAASARVGHVNVTFDADGLVRRFRPVFAENENLQQMMIEIGKLAGVNRAHRQDALIPYHQSGAYRHVSASTVMRGEVPAAYFRDKLVLVGASAKGLGDTLPVPGPAGSVMSGIEVQANILGALLAGSKISAASTAERSSAALVVLLLAFFGFLRTRPTTAILIAVGLGVITLSGSVLLLTIGDHWHPPGAILLGLTLAYPLWSWRRLAVLNNFIEGETTALGASLSHEGPSEKPKMGLDAIAATAASLKAVIGELVDLKTFMKRVIDNAPDALAVVDKDDRIILANTRAINLFGDEIDKLPVASLMARIAPDSQSDAEEIVHSDGRTFLAKSAPFGADAGSILRLADISDRRTAERQREEAIEFLSHDMRAPQSSIVALLDLHEAKRESELPIARIRSLAETSLKMADDFVQLARLENSVPEFEDVDLSSLLDEASNRLYAKAKAKSIRIKMVLCDDPAFVRADGWQLSRAFANLIDNAIKYSPEGSEVVCGVAMQDGETHASAGFEISIEDHGEGIPIERRDALFAPFGAQKKSSDLSAGLGLAYVKRVVDQHRGLINCQSGSDGTIFRLWLPAASEID